MRTALPAGPAAAGQLRSSAVSRLGPILLAACGGLLLFFGGLGAFPLLEPDEGRYYEIPHEMLLSGDFVSPHLNGVLYFEKPPLYYWLNAGATALFRSHEIGARIVGAVFGLAGLGLVWLLGSAMGGRRAGLWAVVLLATSPLYIILARIAIIDMTLTFFLSAALTCFWLTQQRDRGRQARWLWRGAFVFSALAVLTKGLIGVLMPGAAVLLFLAFTRRWAVLRRVPWASGLLLFLAIAVPWHVLVTLRNPDFLWFYFVHEHILRYATPEAQRLAPFWIYAAVVMGGMIPWSGVLPASLLFLCSSARSRDRAPLVFLACWAGFVILFFSLSKSKLVPYVLPAFPPMALLAALTWVETDERELRTRSWLRVGVMAAAVLLALLPLGFLWVSLGQARALSPFLSPVLLAVALLALATAATAAWLWYRSRTEEDRSRAIMALSGAAVLLVGCLWAVGPRVAGSQSSRDLARVLKERLGPGDEVYSYHCYPQTLPVYLGRQIGVVHYRGELGFGIDHLPPDERARRFPTSAQFAPAWRSGRPIYVVLQSKDLDRMQREGLNPGPILLRKGGLLLMGNRAVLTERKPL